MSWVIYYLFIGLYLVSYSLVMYRASWKIGEKSKLRITLQVFYIITLWLPIVAIKLLDLMVINFFIPNKER